MRIEGIEKDRICTFHSKYCTYSSIDNEPYEQAANREEKGRKTGEEKREGTKIG